MSVWKTRWSDEVLYPNWQKADESLHLFDNFLEVYSSCHPQNWVWLHTKLQLNEIKRILKPLVIFLNSYLYLIRFKFQYATPFKNLLKVCKPIFIVCSYSLKKYLKMCTRVDDVINKNKPSIKTKIFCVQLSCCIL